MRKENLFYEQIKKILESSSDYRNSHRKTIWRVWEIGMFTFAGMLSYENFMRATNPETVRRTIQMVVADHPELQSDKKVLAEKKKKEVTKGTFGFREMVKEHSSTQFDYKPTLF